MHCDDARVLINGLVDEELDAKARASLHAHLETCARCRGRLAAHRALRSALVRAAPAAEAAPAGLAERIGARLGPAGATPPSSVPGFAASPAPRSHWLAWLRPPGRSFAAGVALAAAAAAIFAALAPDRPAPEAVARADEADRLGDEAVAAHRRSLLENHLLDFATADADAARRWLQARLPYAVPVADLSGAGYALAGARLDYLYERPLAALVYRKGDAVINLFVWPHRADDRLPAAALTDEGVQVLFWSRGALDFCATASGDTQALHRLPGLVPAPSRPLAPAPTPSPPSAASAARRPRRTPVPRSR